MKVAISNIAWPADQDAAIADVLTALDVQGIEIAPTKLWPKPLEATDAEIDATRDFWEGYGISIVAAQALLFGRPDLTLFDDVLIRQKTLTYLHGIVRVCARVGAKALVFGSPRNRRAGERDRNLVWQMAVDFFGQLGELATREGTTIVLEANPPDYGADFITTASEALRLVQEVHHPGFRLHLDTACMMMAGDDAASIIPAAAPYLTHFHASEPHLAPVGQGTIDHERFARPLAATVYSGWVSIEMRQPEPFAVQPIREAVVKIKENYAVV